jgi:type II secretion system protein C
MTEKIILRLRSMAKKEKTNKIASKVPHWVEAFVVHLSLQHPDYGPRRLVPVLEKEGITVTASTVYTILKRNNLQNKSLRLSKLEEQRTSEIVAEPADIIEPEAEEPEPAPIPAHTVEIKPQPSKSPASKSLSIFSDRRFRSYALPSLLVLGLVGYFCISAALELLRAGREPVIESQSAPAEAISKAETSARPLEDYNIIHERNLFGGSQGQVSVSQEDVSVEDVPAADKSLGLKLVGTVAGDDSATSFAIIDNIKTRKQELYHEGDKAGDVLIKKILRNKVIVDAGRGEELLALEFEETGKRIEFSPTPQPAVRNRRTATREQSLQFDQAEVEASLQNVDQVIQELNISPYTRAGKPYGFRIGKLPRDSILIAMGLRTGDLITGVNDQTITGPEQAAEFLQTLKQGGDVTIKVGKGRGVRIRGRLIHLKIE